MPSKKILIIEDDEDLGALLAESLEDEGFCTAYTHDPAQGETLIRCGEYDTLLLDYKMPGLNGTEIVKRIKTENIPMKIFIVSGRPFLNQLLEKEGLAGSVRAVIPKPIDFEGLLEKLRQPHPL